MITKSITLNGTYKIKSKQLEFNKACEELKQLIMKMLDSDEFNDRMCAVTKEVAINVDRKVEPEVEFIITMFITITDDKPRRLLRKYMEDYLINIEHEQFKAKLIKRRIY